MMNRYRVAIIGCGNIAGGYDEQDAARVFCRTHAQAVNNRADLELVAVADRDASIAKQFAQRWGAHRAFDNLDDLIRETLPQVACVCVPTSVQHEVLNRLLANPSTIAVLCEKPFGENTESAEKVADEFRVRGIPLAVNYTRNYLPAFRELARRIDAREFGDVVAARVTYNRGFRNAASHAIAFLRQFLGDFHGWQGSATARCAVCNDVNLSGTAHFGAVPVHFVGLADGPFCVFEITLYATERRIELREFGETLSVQAWDGSAVTNCSTGLDQCMDDVFDAFIGFIGGQPEAKVVQAHEACAVLRICNEILSH